MIRCCAYIFVVLTAISVQVNAEIRQWTDATGRYSLDAELVLFNDTSVVLKREDHEMVSIPVQDLSSRDREFLASQPARDMRDRAINGVQTWHLRNDTEISGRMVDYAQREITLVRRRGSFYVDDRRLDNLPDFYQQILPSIVAHFEALPSIDRPGLERWLIQQRGRPRTIHLEGVVLETENGDEYAVPFFLFPDADARLFQAGWSEWQRAQEQNDFTTLEDLAFLIQSLAAARAEDKQVLRQIATMQLKMQAVQAGLTSLWEVTLLPPPGSFARPIWVVVPGENSDAAAFNALQQNPGFVVGAIRRVSG